MNIITSKRFGGLLLLILVAFATAGCSSAAPQDAPLPTTDKELAETPSPSDYGVLFTAAKGSPEYIESLMTLASPSNEWRDYFERQIADPNVPIADKRWLFAFDKALRSQRMADLNGAREVDALVASLRSATSEDGVSPEEWADDYAAIEGGEQAFAVNLPGSEADGGGQ